MSAPPPARPPRGYREAPSSAPRRKVSMKYRRPEHQAAQPGPISLVPNNGRGFLKVCFTEELGKPFKAYVVACEHYIYIFKKDPKGNPQKEPPSVVFPTRAITNVKYVPAVGKKGGAGLVSFYPNLIPHLSVKRIWFQHDPKKKYKPSDNWMAIFSIYPHFDPNSVEAPARGPPVARPVRPPPRPRTPPSQSEPVSNSNDSVVGLKTAGSTTHQLNGSSLFRIEPSSNSSSNNNSANNSPRVINPAGRAALTNPRSSRVNISATNPASSGPAEGRPAAGGRGLVREGSTGGEPPAPVSSSPPDLSNPPFKVIVEHKFEATHPSQLSIEVGMELEVLQVEPVGGWFLADLNGQGGWFPNSFVRVVAPPAPLPGRTRTPPRTPIPGTPVRGSPRDHAQKQASMLAEAALLKSQKDNARATPASDQPPTRPARPAQVAQVSQGAAIGRRHTSNRPPPPLRRSQNPAEYVRSESKRSLPTQPPPRRTSSVKTGLRQSMSPSGMKQLHSDLGEHWTITAEEEKRYHSEFERIDENGDQSIDMEELSNFLEQRAQNISPADLNNIIKLAEYHSNGELARDEFFVCLKLLDTLEKGLPLPSPTSPLPGPLLASLDAIFTVSADGIGIEADYWSIREYEVADYNKEFDSLDVDGDGTLSMEELLPFLSGRAAALSPEEVHNVIQLADYHDDGQLARDEFFIALKLIALVTQGISIPPAGGQLPEALQLSLKSLFNFKENSRTAEISPWTINQFEETKFSAMFDAMDINGDGMLDLNELIDFFKIRAPNLSPQQVRDVIKFADYHTDGELEKAEFFVALKFIENLEKGITLPNDSPLPDPLVVSLHSIFGSANSSVQKYQEAANELGLTPGQPIHVKWSDGLWYPATFVAVRPEGFFVQYEGFDESEIVQEERMAM